MSWYYYSCSAYYCVFKIENLFGAQFSEYKNVYKITQKILAQNFDHQMPFKLLNFKFKRFRKILDFFYTN